MRKENISKSAKTKLAGVGGNACENTTTTGSINSSGIREIPEVKENGNIVKKGGGGEREGKTRVERHGSRSLASRSKNTKGVTDVVLTRTDRSCPFSLHAHINLYMFSA